MTALFGPAGNSESFAANGHKKTIEVPAFVNEFGLTAYEYQCEFVYKRRYLYRL